MRVCARLSVVWWCLCVGCDVNVDCFFLFYCVLRVACWLLFVGCCLFAFVVCCCCGSCNACYRLFWCVLCVDGGVVHVVLFVCLPFLVRCSLAV